MTATFFFIFVFSIQLSEATALPTEPQPLPKESVVLYIQLITYFLVWSLKLETIRTVILPPTVSVLWLGRQYYYQLLKAKVVKQFSRIIRLKRQSSKFRNLFGSIKDLEFDGKEEEEDWRQFLTDVLTSTRHFRAIQKQKLVRSGFLPKISGSIVHLDFELIFLHRLDLVIENGARVIVNGMVLES